MERSDVALEAKVAQLVCELEEARGELAISKTQLESELQEARCQRAEFAASKAWLKSELEARTRELTATGDVLKVISRSTFDLQTVLDTLTEIGSTIVRRRYCHHSAPRGRGLPGCSDLRPERKAARPFCYLSDCAEPRIRVWPSRHGVPHDPRTGCPRGSRIQPPPLTRFCIDTGNARRSADAGRDSDRRIHAATPKA